MASIEDADDHADDEVEEEAGLLAALLEPVLDGDRHQLEAEVKERGGVLETADLVELLLVTEVLDAELSHQFKVDARVGLLDIDEGHVLYGFSAFVGAGIAHLVVDGGVGAALADEAVLELASMLLQPV